MIPKIIHYCWFGGNPLPDSAIKCINSWKKFFPDYTIKEWNETNFDFNCNAYVREAYESKKWAFVSDYARFWILYHNGGIYFDTDVEVLKSFDDILDRGGFMGQEAFVTSDVKLLDKKDKDLDSSAVVNSGLDITVAPGLGIAVAPGVQLYKELLDLYDGLHFIKDGVIDITTICVHTTNILKRYGYDEKNENIQNIAGITIYPPDFFCPLNYKTGEILMTDNTHSIHWYGATWSSDFDIKISEKRRFYIEKYGEDKGQIYFKIATIPNRLRRAIDERGIWGTVLFIREKINIYLKKKKV
mgnify:CR=1 FL=1